MNNPTCDLASIGNQYPFDETHIQQQQYQNIFQMDLLFDESLVKSIKPLGLAVLGIASVITLAYGFRRYLGDDDQQQEIEFSQKNKKKPAGIYNQGNTCFANSLLQALAPLKLFIKNLEQLTKYCEGRFNQHEQLLFELKQSLLKINHAEGNIDIIKFLNAIGQLSEIVNLEQQDAYELFSIIVSSFEHVYNQHKNINLCRSSLSAASSDELEETFINCSVSYDNSDEIRNNLLGYTKSSIMCSGCNEERNIKIHSFYNLSFDISLFTIRSLDDAINHFQQKQEIEDWACPQCSIKSHIQKLQRVKAQLNLSKGEHHQFLIAACDQIHKFLIQPHDDLEIGQLNQKLGNFVKKFEKQYLLLQNNQYRDLIFVEITPVLKKITKQTIISKFPKILILHLKQLSINPMTGDPMLLRKHIKFPNNLRIPMRNGEKKYDLVSLISHSGNESQGHYFTFRKLDSSTQNWFFISDTTSMECRESFIKSHMPYMLFYQLMQ